MIVGQAGFEPTKPIKVMDLQSTAIDHYATSPFDHQARNLMDNNF